MSTCFALPSPLGFTRPVVVEASRCRVSPHILPRTLAKLCIPSPSDAALTAEYSSLSAVDNDTSRCFFVHFLRQRPPLKIAPPDIDRRVAGSPPQSASEFVPRLPLWSKLQWHFSLALPARYLPILLTRSQSRTVGLAIHSVACLHRSKLEIWSILRQITVACHQSNVLCNVTSWECPTVRLIVVCHLHPVPVVPVTLVVPFVLCFDLPLFTLAPALAFFTSWIAFFFLSTDHGSRGMMRPFQVKFFQSLPGVSLICLDGDSVTTPLFDRIQYPATFLMVSVLADHLLLGSHIFSISF